MAVCGAMRTTTASLPPIAAFISIPAYRRMTPPDREGLYFVGLVQPIGPTIPLVERQAEWLAAVLSGEVTLPARDTMEREIDRHHTELTAALSDRPATPSRSISGPMQESSPRIAASGVLAHDKCDIGGGNA